MVKKKKEKGRIRSQIKTKGGSKIKYARKNYSEIRQTDSEKQRKRERVRGREIER